MAQLIKWGSPGADFGNAFAAQMQQNAAAEAKMSQDADANRRENKKVEIATEANAREGALFQANINVAESSFSGWDPKRNTSMFTPDLMAKWTSIDNMVSDWKGLSGPEKNAMSLAIGVGIKDFETNLSSHQTMVSVQKHYAYAEAVAARFGTEVPEHIVEAYQQAIGGGGTGGSGSKGRIGAQQNPAELSRVIRAWASQQQVLEANAAEQDSIMRESIDMLSFIATQKTKGEGGGEDGSVWDHIKESWDAVLDAINDGETEPEVIRRLVSTARGLTSIMQGAGDGAAAYANQYKDFKKNERVLQANMDDLAVYSQLAGVSPFTDYAKSLVEASRWGKGKLFGSDYNTADLQASKNTTDLILKQAGERHPGLGPIELRQKAHEEIVSINGLYPDLVKDARKTKNWMPAIRAYDAGYMAAQGIDFAGPAGLGKMLTAEAMSPGVGPVFPAFIHATKGGVSQLPRSTGTHLRLGPAFKEVFAEHNEMRNKNNVGLGVLGLERLLENRSIDPADIIGKTFKEIMKEYPDLADAIARWQANPPVEKESKTKNWDPFGIRGSQPAVGDGMPEPKWGTALKRSYRMKAATTIMLQQAAASSDLEASGGMAPVMPDPSWGGVPRVSLDGFGRPEYAGMAPGLDPATASSDLEASGGMVPAELQQDLTDEQFEQGAEYRAEQGVEQDIEQIEKWEGWAQSVSAHGVKNRPGKTRWDNFKRILNADYAPSEEPRRIADLRKEVKAWTKAQPSRSWTRIKTKDAEKMATRIGSIAADLERGIQEVYPGGVESFEYDTKKLEEVRELERQLSVKASGNAPKGRLIALKKLAAAEAAIAAILLEIKNAASQSSPQSGLGMPGFQ